MSDSEWAQIAPYLPKVRVGQPRKYAKRKLLNAMLTESQKRRNRALARKRIVIEHVFRRLKVFRILSEKYRNRRQRFAIRFNLIATLYNLELNVS